MLTLSQLATGIVVSAIVNRKRRNLGGEDPKPKIYLQAIWTGEILVPVSRVNLERLKVLPKGRNILYIDSITKRCVRYELGFKGFGFW